ncbi:MAG: hypothetical protein AB7G15_02350 [Alphaproteobacteria bacterium]
MTVRGVHDIGGLPGGPIDRSEHPRTLYEQRVDALVMLLSHPDRSAFKVDALRRAIEEFNAKDYDTLPYYDKWMRAVRVLMVEQGVLTDAEIDARVAEIERELAASGVHAR